MLHNLTTGTHIYTHTCCTHTQSHIMTSHLFVKYLFPLCKFVTPVVQIKNESMKQEKCDLKKKKQTETLLQKNRKTNYSGTKSRSFGWWHMQDKIKIRPSQRCFLNRSSPDIQLLKRPPLRRRCASLLDQRGVRQSDIIYSPVALRYLCLPAHLRSCTIHLYTLIYITSLFSVCLCQKILH